ncbi:hypothetical protein CRU92_04675 [Arcobacter sp. FW59]|nr:hypothetical protein CRU92_04675 [Arcobacter sp. FW59]
MKLIYLILILSFISINIFFPNGLFSIFLYISIFILYLYFENIDSDKFKIISFLEEKEIIIRKYINLNLTIKIFQVIFILLVIYSFYKLLLRIQ